MLWSYEKVGQKKNHFRGYLGLGDVAEFFIHSLRSRSPETLGTLRLKHDNKRFNQLITFNCDSSQTPVLLGKMTISVTVSRICYLFKPLKVFFIFYNTTTTTFSTYLTNTSYGG